MAAKKRATSKLQEDHFKSFALSLERAIAGYASSKDDVFERQKDQIERLVALEQKFRDTLVAHECGKSVYHLFVDHIRFERCNILDARPFFRERQTTFTATISPALKVRDVDVLQKCAINYRFVGFVMGLVDWSSTELPGIAKEIQKLRHELITQNMPLAISRARIFWSRTPKSHLSYMDLVQISSEGLMSAVDKFVPPFCTAFRAMAIGRVMGNHIEAYNETTLHFYPLDKRKLYRAHRAARRCVGGVDYVQVAQAVNADLDGGFSTNPDEIAQLMLAASTIPLEPPSSMYGSGDSDNPDKSVSGQWATVPVEQQPDSMVEEREKSRAVRAAFDVLTTFEQKLLRLKGVDLNSL